MLDTATRTLAAPTDNLFARLPGDFYTKMAPEGAGARPLLIHANQKAAALVGLDPAFFSDPAFAEIFSGHRPYPGGDPLAMVYSGHQFGAWAGQLGDGRALLIAQVRNAQGELWDVQLKGAGKTPYSRFGDGRAVMRSTIREYLCSEAMAGLGIPTTRALAVMATNEKVHRETPEPGAVLTRLARSHIRFGHFEHFHHGGRPDLVRILADHVIGEYMPEFAGDHPAWFGEVVKRTAHLIAAWQAAGFAHGVMNTDNMSILGLTMDYGPFGFLDAYEPGFICNHSDDTGRYAFDMQPAIAHWNLRALALALSSLIPTPALVVALDTYESLFRERYRALMRAKLGLVRDGGRDDDTLIAELLSLMAKVRADYTLTFRGLQDAGEAWLTLFAPVHAEAAGWLVRYRARTENEARGAMNGVNPKYILRNWVAETAIRALEDNGDTGPLDHILRLVTIPYDDHPGADSFGQPPAPEYGGLSVSCSS
ncbi:MAG TPA: YdiU family protein [Rhizomicrobium sp.]|nr:YdiU family protein [Rhizomicrobium sp.]